MSRIFLCHASEDNPIAEPVQLALVGAGHKVFYDEQSLQPAGEYHERITSAIKKCDLFVFLASPASTAPGRFTLFELKVAKARWPSPVGRVLPVVVKGLSSKDLPPYLQATVALRPTGNVAAEVVMAVGDLLRQRRRRAIARALQRAAALVVALAAALAVWALWWSRPPKSRELLSVTVRSQHPVQADEIEFCLRATNYPPDFDESSFNVTVNDDSWNCTQVPWGTYGVCDNTRHYAIDVKPSGSPESADLRIWRHEGPCPPSLQEIGAKCSTEVVKC